MAETNFTLGPISETLNFLFITGLPFPRIRDLRAIFKAALMAVDTGCFFHWYPPKKLKYGKPRLGESTLT